MERENNYTIENKNNISDYQKKASSEICITVFLPS